MAEPGGSHQADRRMTARFGFGHAVAAEIGADRLECAATECTGRMSAGYRRSCIPRRDHEGVRASVERRVVCLLGKRRDVIRGTENSEDQGNASSSCKAAVFVPRVPVT